MKEQWNSHRDCVRVCAVCCACCHFPFSRISFCNGQRAVIAFGHSTGKWKDSGISILIFWSAGSNVSEYDYGCPLSREWSCNSCQLRLFPRFVTRMAMGLKIQWPGMRSGYWASLYQNILYIDCLSWNKEITDYIYLTVFLFALTASYVHLLSFVFLGHKFANRDQSD